MRRRVDSAHVRLYCTSSSSMCECTEVVLRAYLQRTLGKQEDTWTIGPSGVSGRGLFATRDIQPGDAVFYDRPVVWGPRALVSMPMCSSCHREGRVTSCPAGCYLPVCSPECSASDLHVRECRLIRESMELPARSWRLDLVGTVAPLRCLFLSEQDREVVRCLQGNKGDTHGREVDLLKSFMKDNLNKEDEEWMRFCCLAMDTNAFELLRVLDDGTVTNLRGLYPLAAIMNHNCSPNTSHHYDRNGVMKVSAARHIAKGDELTASYGSLFWATTFRRLFLRKSKDFMCRCLRCSDPTEFGTMLSGLPCTDDACQGILLPANSLNLRSPSLCNSCSVKVSPQQRTKLQIARGAEMDKYGSAEPIEVAHYLAHSFLPTSQIDVQLKCSMILKLGHHEGFSLSDLSQDVLDFKESCCRDILHLMEKLKLGLCRARGIFLMELHGTLCEQLRRQMKSGHKIRDGMEAEIQATLSAANVIAGDDATAHAELNKRTREQNELIPEL